MRYMVMECHPSYAVVLDEEGIFRKVANRRYEVGETVDEVVEMQEAPASKKSNRRWITSIAAVAACCVLAVASFLYMNMDPYASIYLTINPEIRIDVDKKDKVVNLEGINKDGKELIKGYDFENKNADKVMDDMVDRSIDMGFLAEGGQITLRLDGNGNWITTNGDYLYEHLNGHLKDKLTVTIIMEQPGGGQKVSIPIDIDEPIKKTAPKKPANGDTDYGTDSYSDYDDDNDYDDDDSDYEERSTPPSNDDSDYENDNSDYGESDLDD